MAEETDKGGLAWVQEPAISDGKVVYKYRNSSETDAQYVGEIISAGGEGSSTAQTFALDGLAAGEEHETHAPMPADLPDGPVSINLQIQSAAGDVWVGELLFELTGQIVGGTLHPAGEQAATAGTLAVDIRDVRLEDEELVVHYRITGDAHLDAVSIFATLMDPQGGQGWMNSFVAEADREDIFRAAIPFADVMDADTGWAVEAHVSGMNLKAEIQAHTKVHLPVERVDGKVVASEGWSSLSES